MSNSTLLGLPLLVEGQASAEVTHNEALHMLDSFTVGQVRDRDATSPPGGVSNGDIYLLPSAGCTGAWAGQDGKLAVYISGGWLFRDPVEGQRVWVCDEDAELRYDGASWQECELSPQSFARVFESAADPTVNDDQGSGYREGDVWVNTATRAVYDCADDTTGAAVWRRRTRNHSAASAPGAGNDQTQGFGAGDLWVDTSGPSAYVCRSAATGAADWQVLGAGSTVTRVTKRMPSSHVNVTDGVWVDPVPMGSSLLHDGSIGTWSSDKLTLSASGYYLIVGVATSGSFSVSNGGADLMAMHHDASAGTDNTVGRCLQHWANLSVGIALNALAIIQADANDQIYLRFRVVGGDGTLFGTAPNYTTLTVYKVG